MAAIQLLPPSVAERIAAGEVIDRPAAVVKELLENALDAGAHDVRLEVRGGGLRSIRIADDGSGIPAGEVELAFRRHATSKLRTLEDLERVTGYGFRGEALASIAAVADVTVLTATEDGVGVSCSLRAGRLIERIAAARGRGTTVTVRDLFSHMPARLRFMRGARAEATEIGAVVRRLALQRPDVRLALVLEGHVAFRATGAGGVEEALAAIYGAGAESAFFTLTPHEVDGIRIAGLVSGRSLTRANRSQVNLYVNGRYVRPRALLAAIEEGYSHFLPHGRHPVAMLQLEVPPADLDVNIHPAKLDVRLRNEAAAARSLSEAVAQVYGRQPARLSPRVDLALSGRQRGLGALAGKSGRVREEAVGWSGEPVSLPPSGALPALRLLGQLHDALLVAETADGVLLIDQHRAHERVIFERLRRGSEQRSQALIEPAIVELRPAEAARLESRLPALLELGFACEGFGRHRFLIRAAPDDPDLAAIAGAVPELLAEAAIEDERWHERLLASISCRSAVRKGRPLSRAEALDLLARLSSTESPAVCPHGSPLLLFLGDSFLERQFAW